MQSESNTRKELDEKLAAYLAAGAREVILVELSGRIRWFDANGERRQRLRAEARVAAAQRSAGTARLTPIDAASRGTQASNPGLESLASNPGLGDSLADPASPDSAMKTHPITVDPEIHSGTPVFAGRAFRSRRCSTISKR